MKNTENYELGIVEKTDFISAETFNNNMEQLDKLLTPEYTGEAELVELTSGEKLAVGFGKIAKAVKALISHLADSTIHFTATEREKLKNITEGANKYTHPSYTARTGVPIANQTPAFGGTFTVTQPVSDGSGHITAMNSKTVTIPSAVATTSAAGLMSAAMVTKLNGIATGANKTTIAANLTTTAEGYALDATMGKMLNDYIENLNYCIGKFKEAKVVSRSHSELGEVKMACIPYDEYAEITTSNKLAIKFTDGSVGIFNVQSNELLSPNPTWLTGTVPYVAKTTIQGGTNTLAITSTGGGYQTWDDEIYTSTGEVKQRMILEISASSGELATEYRII